MFPKILPSFPGCPAGPGGPGGPGRPIAAIQSNLKRFFNCSENTDYRIFPFLYRNITQHNIVMPYAQTWFCQL